MKTIKLDDSQIEQFRLKMKADGWQPVNDRFGISVAWRHTETEKQVKHTDAVRYWWMSGQSPVPF